MPAVTFQIFLAVPVVRIEQKIKDPKRHEQDSKEKDCYNVVRTSGSGERLTLTLSKSKTHEEKHGKLLLTTLTSGPNFCMIVAENAAPANNRR